jgi:hypothetical protein
MIVINQIFIRIDGVNPVTLILIVLFERVAKLD